MHGWIAGSLCPSGWLAGWWFWLGQNLLVDWLADYQFYWMTGRLWLGLIWLDILLDAWLQASYLSSLLDT